MTGATPRGSGEQTQPMACPPGRAARGPYADADTIDGPAPDARDAGADWPDAARLPPRSGGPLLASVTVGRDPGNDIVLVDQAVGGEHAKIEYCEGQWWLQPADSAGPTWVNGQPVQPGQRLPVTDGDRLRFGFHTQFRLLVPSAR